MADAGFFKGTSADQDSRFANKQKKLLKQMKFPDNIDVKIDMVKVKLNVIKPWITSRLQELLGIEDDVVIEYVFNQLDEKHPDPKMMQINLTGFLGGNKARIFVGELWNFLISAQKSPDGIPEQLVEMKKQELLKRQHDDERLRNICKRQEETQRTQIKMESETVSSVSNGRDSEKASQNKMNLQSNRTANDKDRVSESPVQQRRDQPAFSSETRKDPNDQKTIAKRAQKDRSSSSSVSPKRQRNKTRQVDESKKRPEVFSPPSSRKQARAEQRKSRDDDESTKRSKQNEENVKPKTHYSPVSSEESPKVVDNKKSVDNKKLSSKEAKQSKKSSRRNRSSSSSSSVSRSSSSSSSSHSHHRKHRKPSKKGTVSKHKSPSRSRSPNPKRKKKSKKTKSSRRISSDRKKKHHDHHRRRRHRQSSGEEKQKSDRDHRQKSISPISDCDGSPSRVDISPPSPVKPRLQSQIRVQTPPPAKRIEIQTNNEQNTQQPSATISKPERRERIILLENDKTDSFDTIEKPDPTLVKSSSLNQFREIHYSSEDENEIDLRERLLREKAIRSMKRRQLSQQQEHQPNTTGGRIVYQT